MDEHEFHLTSAATQVRQLLSVAVATNRTVVMPKLMCYCDRYWGPLQRCRLPGATRLVLPFVCPLDHIFEPFHFDDKPEQFGPPIAYREHSFFENDRTPSAIKDGARLLAVTIPHTNSPSQDVQLTDGAARADAITLKLDESAPAGRVAIEDAYHLRAGPNTSLHTLQESLDAVSASVVRLDFVLLQSSDEVTFALEPFDDQDLQKRFEYRLEHMPGFWCCRQPDGPKGIGGTSYGDILLGKGIVHRT